MNSHYCRVGTIKPTEKKNLILNESKNNSIKKAVKVIPLGKLSKKIA